MEKGGCVYILSNKNRTVFYTGVTSDIRHRIYQHRYENGSKLTTKYNVKNLLYFQSYPSIEEAIHNEKLLKKWNRNWKLELIQKNNPEFIDLAIDWFDENYD